MNELGKLARVISRERNRRGWTQKELAAAAKVSDSTLERIEQSRGAFPSVRILNKIAAGLGCFYNQDARRFEPLGVMVHIPPQAHAKLLRAAKAQGLTVVELIEQYADNLAMLRNPATAEPLARLRSGAATTAANGS